MRVEPPVGHAAISELGRGLRCNTKFAALVIVLFPLLMALGCWQLWRAGEKAEALAIAEQRSAGSPRRIGTLGQDIAAELDRTPVVLVGHYQSGRDFLLDNRIFKGAVGYELITPFVDQDGTVVFVNRGWLAGMRTRQQLPVPEHIGGTLRLVGDIHAPEDRRRLQMYAGSGWPRVIQAVDIVAMAQMLEIETYPYLIRLHPGQPGVTDADWPTVNITPERHIAYAVQWFVMGGALLVVFVLGGTNIREWLSHGQKEKPRDG